MKNSTCACKNILYVYMYILEKILGKMKASRHQDVHLVTFVRVFGKGRDREVYEGK